MSRIAFCDSASGERRGNDKFSVAFAHCERDHVVLDLLRWWAPPFSPSAVIAEIAALLHRYHIRQIAGDRYSPGFVAEQFHQHGIRYQPSPLDRSEIYLEFLSLVNSRQVLLLDVPELIGELRSLERRRGAGGRDRVEHAPGGHDDLANSAAGALVLATRDRRRAKVAELTRWALDLCLDPSNRRDTYGPSAWHVDHVSEADDD